MSYPRVTLGDHADLLTGYPFKSQSFSEDPNDIRLLRGDNVAQGYLRWDGAKYWPLAAADRLDDYMLREGDVILAMDRPWIEAGLKYAVVRPSDLPALLVQRVARLRGGSQLDTRFLKYVIGTKGFTDYILSVQTGTTVPHISPTQIKGYEFELPPLAEQRAIAHILGTLDDKIELNRKMNETLEAMARATFKSWFIDFDPVRAKAEGRQPEGMDAETSSLFPTAFDNDDLPSGWRRGVVGDVAHQLRLGVDPTCVPQETPYIGLEHMPQRSITLGEWGMASDAQSQKSRFSKGDILFGKLRPYFHKVGVAPVDGLCSTDIVVVQPNVPSLFSFCLEHLSSEEFVAFTTAGSDGTRMPRTSWNQMTAYAIVIPSDSCVAALDGLCRPLIERIHANIFESRTLTEVREILLPKLLAGEIRVQDAEKQLEEAL